MTSPELNIADAIREVTSAMQKAKNGSSGKALAQTACSPVNFQQSKGSSSVCLRPEAAFF